MITTTNLSAGPGEAHHWGLHHAVAWTVIRESCGCVMPLKVRLERRITTMAARCEHHEPSEIALGGARLYPGD